MRKILIVILCLGLAGCTVISKSKKLEGQVVGFQEILSSRDEEILKKDETINKLQGLLKEKNNQLKEKDAKIEEMRERLEMFGVFEK